MGKVLLLGGTGAIGKYVAKNCSDLGYKVFITSRSKRISSDDNISYICGDATDYKFISSVLLANRFDAIVDFMVYKSSEFYKRINLILNNTEHYLFLSSYRVFCDSGLQPLKEDSLRLLDNCGNKKYFKTDEYALAKARQEDALVRNVKQNWTIVRPSITYAAGRFQLGSLEANVILPRASVGLPVILPTEMMKLYTTMSWAGDVGRMITSILFKQECMGTDFNVTTDEKITWECVAKIYNDTIGLNVINVSFDDYLSLGLNPFQLKYDRLYNRICDNGKIIKFSGLKKDAFKTVRNGLSYELERTNLKNFSSFSRIHGRMDKVLGISRFGQAIQSKRFIKYLTGYMPISNKLYNLRKWK